jgi:hypothetical protein
MSCTYLGVEPFWQVVDKVEDLGLTTRLAQRHFGRFALGCGTRWRQSGFKQWQLAVENVVANSVILDWFEIQNNSNVNMSVSHLIHNVPQRSIERTS